MLFALGPVAARIGPRVLSTNSDFRAREIAITMQEPLAQRPSRVGFWRSLLLIRIYAFSPVYVIKDSAHEEGTLCPMAAQSGCAILSDVVCPWPRGRAGRAPRPLCEVRFFACRQRQ